MSTPSLPDGVAWTAVLVAAQRAAESMAAEPAFRDPLAEVTLVHLGLTRPGQAPRWDDMPGGMAGLTRLMGDMVILRTLYNDRLLTDLPVEQIVLLGAGLDGRAYRLPWAGRRIFELDRRAILALKEDVARAAGLEQTAERTPVVADLAEDWPAALLAEGFDPSRPTGWVAEGLTIFLNRAELELLLTRVGELSAPGSHLGIEVATPLRRALSDAEAADDGVSRVLSLLGSGPPTPPHDWLAGHGWRLAVRTLTELAEQYGRPVPQWFDTSRGGATLWYFDCAR
ncbi:S-adenosyl-L-methionine-dependent methyltransferase [Paractinoplanes abujensis]|uniref:S-adenosyl-L-methionine-dependent methyltransferase n=1 Tax=Paractinoplanes abujensis TaxID=882441 RepID=A0A7W7G0P4_9ACTN|nr:SAM-dependent methyltransferase [Actinoplanes abujensis]MBB4693293.1 methyltransferase (TIGR00027 family) [Actinoplanes abujensis]GID24493.1 S-adenosyl-L-methionine-dependent methyltransferase [Actinoplanes abujensis]